MKSLLITVTMLFVVVAVGTSAFSTITEVVCDGFDCKQNCKPKISYPLGKCVQNPANASQSAIFQCIPAPAGQMCYTQTLFNTTLPGGIACSPNTLMDKFSQRCNICNNADAKKYPNSSSIAVCTADSITMKYSCDATCTNCQTTEKYPVKQCTKYTGVMVSPPFSCNVEVKGMEWDNAGSCGGAAPQRFQTAAGLCNGYINQTTNKPESRMTTCS